MIKLFDFFKRKNKLSDTSANINFIDILSPINGEVIDLSQIPDEAFASGLLGDGVGISPAEGSSTVYSPVSTDSMNIYETGHAVTFECHGLELIIHIGVDTVKFKGKGFEKLHSDGITKKNEAIVKYDLEFIKNNAKSAKTAVVIANMEKVEKIEKKSGNLEAGDLLMRVYLK